jgi:hypothetical protein
MWVSRNKVKMLTEGQSVESIGGVSQMATNRQKQSTGQGMSTADRDRLADSEFAFPEERKEPLSDASHVRNAIARFDQVEGVSDQERDDAWGRITRAARRFDVAVSEGDWRELFSGGKAQKR